jgi:hypothetical protein
VVGSVNVIAVYNVSRVGVRAVHVVDSAVGIVSFYRYMMSGHHFTVFVIAACRA